MIKFFRNIRKKLAAENKIVAYSRYAIGEIVLVVIGILIAIQLNEWRNENLDHNKKLNILKALKAEYEANLKQLDTVLFYDKKISVAYSNLNEMYNRSFVGYTEEHIVRAVIEHSYTWTFNPINGALRSAISSGDIHLITNKRLVELLFSWEDIVEDSYEEAKTMRQFQYDRLDFFSKYVRVFDAERLYHDKLIAPTNFSSDYHALLKDPAFEDYRTASHFYAYEYISELEVIKKYNLELLNLIEQEIQN